MSCLLPDHKGTGTHKPHKTFVFIAGILLMVPIFGNGVPGVYTEQITSCWVRLIGEAGESGWR